MLQIEQWDQRAVNWLASQGFTATSDVIVPEERQKKLDQAMMASNKKLWDGDTRGAFNVLVPHADILIDPGQYAALLSFVAGQIDLLAPRTVLDAGCGFGVYSCFLAEMFPEIDFIGVDISDASIELARKRAKKAGRWNAHFEAFDYRRITRTTKSAPYDMVLMTACLHYDWDEQGEIVESIMKVMQSNAHFITDFPEDPAPRTVRQAAFERIGLQLKNQLDATLPESEQDPLAVYQKID